MAILVIFGALGVAAGCQAVGAFIMPLAFQKLVASSGWQTAIFALAALELVICLPLVAFLVKDDPHPLGLHPDGDDADHAAPVAAEGPTVREIVRTGTFWKLAVAFAIMGMSFYALTTNVAFILTKSAGLTLAQVATIQAITGVAVLFGRVGFGYLLDKFSATTVGLLALALSAIYFAAYGAGTNFAFIAVAALIGGADYSSNVGISHVLGVPPKGTHAHSMVQVFMALGGNELDAFRAFADIYPDDCLLLVDTVDTLESGVPNAIQVFEELRRKGHEPVGIRLDSGDLAHLSIQSANMLDKAGFPNAEIVLSNQLDELIIWQIITQIEEEAGRYGVDPDKLIERLVFGVGTRLITSAGDSALDGVYKLVAVEKNGSWAPAIKISENPVKIPNPGHKHVWRIYDQRGYATADLLSLEDEDPRDMERITLRHPIEIHTYRHLEKQEVSRVEPLLVEVLRDGKLVYELPNLEEIRKVRLADRSALDPGVRRLMNPHTYHVSLTQRLWDLKQDLIKATTKE